VVGSFIKIAGPWLKQNPITEPFAGLSIVANLLRQKSTIAPTAKLSPIEEKLNSLLTF